VPARAWGFESPFAHQLAETTILLVRHADVHNPGRLFYGRLPRFRISELGRRQAAFLAERLAPRPIAAFYTSPMLRARQTAKILAERHPDAPFREDRRLIEVRTGWMGSVETLIPPVINLYEPPHTEGDETIEEVWRRVDRLIRQLVRRHHGQTVCCVSHGDPVVIAHAGYTGLPLALASIRGGFYPQKCSVTELVFPGGEDQPKVTYRDVIGELAPDLKAPH
jgi:broad specificity phosphatase PhoE